eukprot:TRINITY_DN3791_c1_g1_i10.p1 TRINITY_DN3791_c1_g1~~TRINITY_DN3791_c1_g1_i10.p1  ORF type:complete len:211 (-),score=-13.08 TRINITY_DN3791_c1_g1_i10:885-1517(-)
MINIQMLIRIKKNSLSSRFYPTCTMQVLILRIAVSKFFIYINLLFFKITKLEFGFRIINIYLFYKFTIFIIFTLPFFVTSYIQLKKRKLLIQIQLNQYNNNNDNNKNTKMLCFHKIYIKKVNQICTSCLVPKRYQKKKIKQSNGKKKAKEKFYQMIVVSQQHLQRQITNLNLAYLISNKNSPLYLLSGKKKINMTPSYALLKLLPQKVQF